MGQALDLAIWVGNVVQIASTDLTIAPEHSKLKMNRDKHSQRSSQYVENQVMIKSPPCWIDHFSNETR